MKLSDLIIRNRSYRRFDQTVVLDLEILKALIDLARISASARNAQPLKYVLSNSEERNDLIFPCLAWAGYLKDWDGPPDRERPSAYIIMLGDTSISDNFHCDHGIAAQSIMLGATEMGLGGCIISSVNRDVLREKLQIPSKYEILQVLAMGKPVERVELTKMKADGDIKYWRDENKVHYVPKRPLEDIILNL